MIAALFVFAASFAMEPERVRPFPEVTAVSGQGGLTAGLDAAGTLTALRWPNPGGANMMHWEHGRPGGYWHVRVNGEFRPIVGSPGRVEFSHTSAGNGFVTVSAAWTDGLRMTQRSAVLPEHDVFVSAIEISGGRGDVSAMWFARFVPTTRRISEAAARENTIAGPRTFAAFVDREDGVVWNFRPENAGADDWAAARALAADGGSADDWAEFNDGVWIALTGSAPMKNAAVTSSPRELGVVMHDGVTMFNAIVGDASTGIQPALEFTDGVYRAWVAIGIGEDSRAAMEGLAGFNPIAALDAAARAPVLPRTIAELPSNVVPYAAHHWIDLRALHDAESGFTVRNVPEARDWPRESAMVAWVLQLLDGAAPPASRLEPYLRLVRTDDRPRRPYGSMPESVYTNGEIASPHFVVDDRAVALTLWSMVQEKTPIEARITWLKQHWPEIQAAGDFLSTWADARRGAPLWCDDPVELSDAETQDRLFAAYAGMNAAVRLATWAEQPVPAAWTARRDQLHELVEWILTTPSKWIPGESIMLELTPLSSDILQRLYEDTIRRLENPTGLTARPLAALLLQSSLLHARDPGIAPLPSERVVLDALTRMADPNHPAYARADSLVSAEVLAALVLRQPLPPQH